MANQTNNLQLEVSQPRLFNLSKAIVIAGGAWTLLTATLPQLKSYLPDNASTPEQKESARSARNEERAIGASIATIGMALGAFSVSLRKIKEE